MTLPDPWDAPEARAWAADVEVRMVPAMRDSQFVVPVWTGEVDAKLAVEIGAAVLMDKPLIIVVQPGVTCPDKLVTIADRIIEGDLASPSTLAAAVRQAFDELAEEGNLDDA